MSSHVPMSGGAPSRGRGRMLPLLGVLLLALPLLEILTIIGVVRLIGGWWTFGLLVLGSLLGAYLIKREGMRAWRALNTAARTGAAPGETPGKRLADGSLILLGGVLLLFPGFLTDVLGLVLILPFTRPLARGVLGYAVARRVGVITPLSGPQNWNGPGGPSGPPGAGTTVRGDVID
ncbi:MAG: FxsA family protein [Actinomycetia bacterium]|nr:FxsA family protein [Actinomycetes bacterium]